MAISNPPVPSILTILRGITTQQGGQTWLTWPPPLLSLDSLEQFFRDNHKLRMDIWKGEERGTPSWMDPVQPDANGLEVQRRLAGGA